MGEVRTEHVRAALAIAETASFRAAALRLGISQSTVSAHIDSLETQLGLTLFERSRSGARLRAAGRLVHPALLGLRDAEDLLRDAARGAVADTSEVIRVAAVNAAVATVLPESLHALVDDPAVEVRVSIRGSRDVIDRIRSQRADLGVIAYEVGREPDAVGIRIDPLLTGAVGVLAPPGHPIARAQRVTTADLRGQRLVAFHPGYLMHAVAERLLADADVRVVSHVDSTPDAIRQVAAGVGICLVPDFSVVAGDAGLWRALEGTADRIGLALTRREDTVPSSRMRRLEQEIHRHAADYRRRHSGPTGSTTVRVTV